MMLIFFSDSGIMEIMKILLTEELKKLHPFSDLSKSDSSDDDNNNI